MPDRRKSHNKNRGYNLINQVELGAFHTLTPVNSANSLQLKTQITRRIQDGYYDQDAVLERIAEQIELICFR